MAKIPASPASPWKRVFAYIYDLLPAFGVFCLALIIGYSLVYGLFLSLQWDVKSIGQTLSAHPLWWGYLLLSVSVYYIWCWKSGGQTIGYKTWRLLLIDEHGQHLSWQASLIRALLSLGGFANLWAFFDPQRRGWHDIAVGAYLVQLPK